MTSVYKWRIYCNTEQIWVTKWENSDITPSAVCFNNSSHSVNASSLLIIQTISQEDTLVKNLPLTSFDEVRVAQRTRLLELTSTFGKSTLRDIYTTTGSATIVNNIGDPAFVLSTSGSTDRALIRSAERGRYVAGLQGEVGIDGLLPQTLTGNQYCRFGLYDDNDGIYFIKNATGIAVGILRAGVETIIPRASWNVDLLDGTGPSKHVLDDTNGIIFKIIFSWYGYGSINFNINTTNSVTNRQNNFLVHVYKPGNVTSLKNPNLPISAEINNNGTAGDRSINVAGRQYSLLGDYHPISRVVSHYRTTASINSRVNFIPIISIRKKTGYNSVPIRDFAIDIISSQDLFLELRIRSTLTGAVFGGVSDTASEDTSAEADTTATALSGGKPVYTTLIAGDIKSNIINASNISYIMSENEIITLCARGVSSSNGNVATVLRWTEEW